MSKKYKMVNGGIIEMPPEEIKRREAEEVIEVTRIAKEIKEKQVKQLYEKASDDYWIEMMEKRAKQTTAPESLKLWYEEYKNGNT